ncbi:acyl-CoA dehydrogenase family protein [Streptomyces sp. CA-100214]
MSALVVSDFALDRPGTDDKTRTLRAELVGKAQEVAPLLAENASKVEEDRRLAEENLEALERVGLLGLTKPRRLGGLEVDLRTELEVVRELGRACGSTAWVTAVFSSMGNMLGRFPERVQHEVWAEKPANRVVGATSSPNAEAIEEEGGYRLSGQFPWTSGSLHAQWAILPCPVRDTEGVVRPGRVAAVPMSQLTVDDTWFMAGMRGTGSNTIVADAVFIPAHRTSVPDKWSLGTEHTEEAAYRAPHLASVALRMVGPQLGLAQAALDLVVEQAPRRRITFTSYSSQADAPIAQLAVAQAASLIDSAHLHAYRAAADIDQAGADSAVPDIGRRARIRMDTCTAVRYATKAIDVLLSVYGASSFAESNPLQRIWRDSEVGARHALLNPAVASDLHGRSIMSRLDEGAALV